MFISGANKLLELVNKNQNSHFFLDEVHLSPSQISSKVLADLHKTICTDSFLWVASQGDRPPRKSDDNFKGNKVVLILDYNTFSFFLTINEKIENLWEQI
jgi:hypothetical protein